MVKNGFSRRAFLRNAAGSSAGVAMASLSVAPAQAAETQADPPYPVTWFIEPSGPTPAKPGTVNEFKLVAQGQIPERCIEKLRADAPGVDLKICDSSDQFLREISDAHVIYGIPTRDEYKTTRQLRWLQARAAGVEELMFPELVSGPVVLTNMQKMFSPTSSETAIGYMLMLTRRLNQYVIQTQEHRWNQLTEEGLYDLSGLTLGLVGLGGFGTDTAYRAHYGFNMRVLATDAKPLHKPHFVEELHSPEWFPTMVPKVDVLVSAAPHTPITHQMFNETVFRSMKPTAYFINLSRGWLVDQVALARALKEHWIAGAALDVTEPEPLPPDDPLWSAGNLIITSHTCAKSEGSTRLADDLFCENVRRYVNGIPLLNVVDKKRGY
jgi:phosphoglycerate dehydrogenase-like enzyme